MNYKTYFYVVIPAGCVITIGFFAFGPRCGLFLTAVGFIALIIGYAVTLMNKKNKKIILKFSKPNGEQFVRARLSYEGMLNDVKKKANRNTVILFGAFGLIIVILIVPVMRLKSIALISYLFFSMIMFGAVAIGFNFAIVSFVKNKVDMIDAGKFTIAQATLENAYEKYVGGRFRTIYYYITVRDEYRFAQEIRIAPSYYPIARGLVGRDIYLVKLDDKRGIYDVYDFCPDI